MGERALATSLAHPASLEEAEDVARRDRANQAPLAESPAIRLLDALRTGDDDGVLAVCGETTAVSAENMDWSCRGPDEIREILEDARRRFPGLAFESRTRHIGFGLVIDEARVQDVVADGQDGQGEAQGDPEDGAAQHAAETSIEQRGAEQRGAEQRGAEQRGAEQPEAEPRVPAKHLAKPDPDIHPMWDEPVSERRNLMSVWREAPSDDVPPAPLNLPVRVTVRHDDLQVHEITLSFPAALLKRALGLHVDPLEMSLSEVQSAFIAPVGAGFTTYTLARPELMVVPPAAPAAEPWIPEEKPRRRRRRLVAPVLVALVAVVATGGWWAVQGKDGDHGLADAVEHPGIAAEPVAV
jgi:hypothetical protein